MISLSVLDQSENGHGVITGGPKALPDEGPAGVGPLPGQFCERRETFAEKPLAMVGRFSARSVSF